MSESIGELGCVTGEAVIIDLQIICISMDEEPQQFETHRQCREQNTMGQLRNLEERHTASLLLRMLSVEHMDVSKINGDDDDACCMTNSENAFLELCWHHATC